MRCSGGKTRRENNQDKEATNPIPSMIIIYQILKYTTMIILFLRQLCQPIHIPNTLKIKTRLAHLTTIFICIVNGYQSSTAGGEKEAHERERKLVEWSNSGGRCRNSRCSCSSICCRGKSACEGYLFLQHTDHHRICLSCDINNVSNLAS